MRPMIESFFRLSVGLLVGGETALETFGTATIGSGNDGG